MNDDYVKTGMYYDKTGAPINSRTQFCELFDDMEYRRIEYTDLGNKDFVSTVWLGINHAHGGGVPIIFETMSFEDGEWVAQQRYENLEDAKKGHKEIVKEVNKRNHEKYSKSSYVRFVDTD